MIEYDVLILGGGPAGLTAVIYASRARLKTGLIENVVPGGQAAKTELIENYPGFDEGILGAELMERMVRQATRFGLQIHSEQVTGLDWKGAVKKIETDQDVYLTKTVIVATGSDSKRLNVPGEKEFKGSGVSTCATCDGPSSANMDVVVVGGGSSGIQESLFLTRFVRSIKLVEFMDKMNAEKILQDKALDNPKFTFYLGHEVLSINGDSKVRSVTVRDRKTGEKKDLPAERVFVWIGMIPNTGFLKGHVRLSPAGYILTDEDLRTSVSGVFAAGDAREKGIRQISTAVGDGTIAALSALHYIENFS